MPDTPQQIVDRVVAQLADVLATTAGQTVRPLPAVGGGAIDWQVPLTIGGAVDASLTLGLTDTAANRVTALVLMAEGAQSEADIADTLREIVTQATAAYVQEAQGRVTLAVGAPRRESATPPPGAWQHDLVMDGDEPPRVAFWLPPSAATTTSAPTEPTRAPAVAGPSSHHTGPQSGAASGGRNLDVVLDLELPITVRFGETRLTLDALSRLGPGSLIDLERSPDEPVELLVNGRLVARGDVVVVGGCYGVRVRDVVSTADRLRTLEG